MVLWARVLCRPQRLHPLAHRLLAVLGLEVLLHPVLDGLRPVANGAQVPVHPLHQRVAAVPEFLAHRVGRHRRVAVQPRGLDNFGRENVNGPREERHAS